MNSPKGMASYLIGTLATLDGQQRPAGYRHSSKRINDMFWDKGYRLFEIPSTSEGYVTGVSIGKFVAPTEASSH